MRKVVIHLRRSVLLDPKSEPYRDIIWNPTLALTMPREKDTRGVAELRRNVPPSLPSHAPGFVSFLIPSSFLSLDAQART